MSALLFPGQGSQIVGMGSEFFKNFDIVKKIFKQADEKLNFPITSPAPFSLLILTRATPRTLLPGRRGSAASGRGR